LIEALKAGVISGAGLDVFDNEPNVPNDLIELENVVLLPHVGSATIETRYEMGKMVYDNIVAFFSNKKLLSPVN
jgi:lactate dehydrogenase-like 2-hydroxyacid dehydrogenase